MTPEPGDQEDGRSAPGSRTPTADLAKQLTRAVLVKEGSLQDGLYKIAQDCTGCRP